MTTAPQDKRKVDELVIRKQELAAKIRELRAEAGKINVELARAGADHSIIASW